MDKTLNVYGSITERIFRTSLDTWTKYFELNAFPLSFGNHLFLLSLKVYKQNTSDSFRNCAVTYNKTGPVILKQKLPCLKKQC